MSALLQSLQQQRQWYLDEAVKEELDGNLAQAQTHRAHAAALELEIESIAPSANAL